MKKVIAKSLALLLAVVTVCGLTACTGYVKQSGELANLEEIPEVSGTIKFSYEANTENKKMAANAYIDAFIAKYPNAKVVRDYDYKTTQADQRISARNIGDVFYFAESEAYNYAKTQGALMPLDHYMQAFKIDTADIYSGIYAAGMIDGKYYYVARDFNQMIMTYNKDALVEAVLTEDVKTGWSWDTFIEVCEKLTNDTQYGAKIDLAYPPVFIPLLNAVGKTDENGRVKTWYNTATRTIDFTSDGMLDAIQQLFEAHDSGWIDLGLASANFAEKEPVFKQHVYIQVDTFGQEFDEKETEWDMIHLPLTNNPMFGCGSSGVGVYNGTKNANAAAAFALFFYTQDGQIAFNGQDGGSVPVLASLKDADFWRHAEDDWSEKNWDANIYMADEYAVIGQFKCILPPEVAEIIENNLRDALIEVTQGADLSTKMGAIQKIANEKWASLAEG